MPSSKVGAFPCLHCLQAQRNLRAMPGTTSPETQSHIIRMKVRRNSIANAYDIDNLQMSLSSTTLSTSPRNYFQASQSAKGFRPTRCSAHTTIYCQGLESTRIMIVAMLEYYSGSEACVGREPCTRSSRKFWQEWGLRSNSTKIAEMPTVLRRTRGQRIRNCRHLAQMWRRRKIVKREADPDGILRALHGTSAWKRNLNLPGDLDLFPGMLTRLSTPTSLFGNIWLARRNIRSQQRQTPIQGLKQMTMSDHG